MTCVDYGYVLTVLGKLYIALYIESLMSKHNQCICMSCFGYSIGLPTFLTRLSKQMQEQNGGASSQLPNKHQCQSSNSAMEETGVY